MANNVVPDQTAPSAVWSGSELFAYTILSEALVYEIFKTGGKTHSFCDSLSSSHYLFMKCIHPTTHRMPDCPSLHSRGIMVSH